MPARGWCGSASAEQAQWCPSLPWELPAVVQVTVQAQAGSLAPSTAAAHTGGHGSGAAMLRFNPVFWGLALKAHK